VVATQSVAVLAASLAQRLESKWLLDGSFTAFLIGAGLYAVTIARFDLRQLRVGRGDHWIAGGALGISALAAATIFHGAQSIGAVGAIAGGMKDAAVALWALTIAWLPPLVVAEIASPRIRYEDERWSSVFPIGMYAACSFVVAGAAGISVIADFARVWVWVALGVWAVVLVATIRSAALGSSS
jgi:tellurite resistance protein TehA-like permease